MSEPGPHMADRLRQDYGWTARQRQVLDLLASGRSNAQLAEELGLSLAGAKWHVAEILSKLQAESREEAAEYWRRYTGAGPRFARVFRGALGLGTWKLAAVGAGAVTMLAGVALGLALLLGAGDEPTADALVSAASSEMETATFATILRECDSCPTLTLIEFAPGRLEVENFERVGENWPHYFISPDGAFVSEEGARWHKEPGGIIGAYLVGDPRFILRGIGDPVITGTENVGPGECTLVEGTLGIERLAPNIPPALDPGVVNLYREFLDGATARVCIDPAEHLVRWMHVIFATGEEGPLPVVFDYTTQVAIPASVESIDPDRESELGQQTTRIGQQFVTAIGSYYDRNGLYPPELTPATLGDVFAWPTNPFTGAPVKQAPNTPGNFDYQPTAGLGEMTFRIDGWDGSQLYYDTAAYGPIPQRDTP